MTAEVFACYSKVCAPPPAGKGGSVKGVISPGARARINERLAAKKAHKKVPTGPLVQKGTTDRNRPGGVGGGSAGSTAKAVKDAAFGKSPHTGKPYSKKNPPPGGNLGAKPISKTDWEKMYRNNRNLGEHE